MFYKNTSYSAKTFHGVTFGPGEIKEVNEYINATCMVAVDKPDTKVTQHTTQQKPSDKLKKGTPKEERKPVVTAIEPADEPESSTKDEPGIEKLSI